MKILYEGKAKILFDDGVPGTLIQHFKDSATAFNAEKKEEFEGKGFFDGAISEHLFTVLAAAGIPTHFVETIDGNRDRVRRVDIIPLEVVVRNRAAGSFVKRFGAPKNLPFVPPLFELYLKDDALGDPQISPEPTGQHQMFTWLLRSPRRKIPLSPASITSISF